MIFTRTEVLTKEKPTKTTKCSSFVSLAENTPIKKNIPSRKRVAIAQAILENISNRKISMKKYRGKFRPKLAMKKTFGAVTTKPKIC